MKSVSTINENSMGSINSIKRLNFFKEQIDKCNLLSKFRNLKLEKVRLTY